MADDYEFETEIRVRFRDLDPMDHVNNAVYSTYLEQARADYFREVVDVTLADVDTVLASLSIDFHRPIEPDETVTIALTVSDLGTSSLSMEYEVRRGDGAVAATAETVQVAYDRETESSRPIPDEWRETIEAAR
ncbi:thioesterase family protein [Halospeciosus flavus]|uniref:Acyl-CoA thioesterase n=1 Tax=Halospeciosus flavus TaxID=3032283 RepID=A0ABD5Z0S8_9EURY